MIRPAVVFVPGFLLVCGVAIQACNSSNNGNINTQKGGAGGSAGAGGSGGPNGGGGSVGTGPGGGGCSPYQALCNGQCVTVVGDPNNCGGCGVKCNPGQVCSGSTCGGSCLPGSG